MSQTVNITLSGNNQQEVIADICEYDGLQGTTPDLTKGNPGTTSNNTYVGTTNVTAQDYELWIGAISFYSNNYDQQIPTNGTLLDGALFNSLSLGYIEIIATVIGTPNCGTQNQGPGVWGGCIAAFKGTGSFAADSPNGLLEIEDVLRIDAPQIYDDPSQDQYITLGVIPGMQGSILQLNASLLTRSDVMVYGSIGSQTDPAKLAIGEGGGGALLIGHGWLGGGSPLALSPPLIELMDSGIQIQSLPAFPSGMAPQDAGALFNRTDQGILYIYGGNPNIGVNGWVTSEATAFSGFYDTLFRGTNNGYTPANLDLGNLSVHENLTVDGSATFNAGILNSIFASPSFGNALANVVDSTLQFVDNLLGIKPTASPTLQGLTLNGNMTIANGYSIMPAADGNSFVGNSSTMFLQVSTRNLVIGNNSGGHSLTFSIDNSGTNLTMTSDSGGGSILPKTNQGTEYWLIKPKMELHLLLKLNNQ